MSDDLERLFESLTPRAAPKSLRPRVLAAVEAELRHRRSRRRRGPIVAGLAALVGCLVINVQLAREADRRLGALLDPPETSRDVAELARDVAEVAGPEARLWLIEAARSARAGVAARPDEAADTIRRLITNESTDPIEVRDETVPQVRPLGRGPGRSAPDPGSFALRVLLLADRRPGRA